jgi:hypothetical protein
MKTFLATMLLFSCGALAQQDYFHGSVYLLGNSASSVNFNNVSVSGPGLFATGTLSLNTTPMAGFGAEVWHSEPNSFGWSAGLTWDAPRTISSSDVTTSGYTFHYDYLNPPTLSITTLYGNAIYRFDDLYIPFGLNGTIPNFYSGETTLQMSGGLGFQLGIGYHINNNFSIECMDRFETFQMSNPQASIYTIDYGTGFMNGLQLNLKFDF